MSNGHSKFCVGLRTLSYVTHPQSIHKKLFSISHTSHDYLVSFSGNNGHNNGDGVNAPIVSPDGTQIVTEAGVLIEKKEQQVA